MGYGVILCAVGFNQTYDTFVILFVLIWEHSWGYT